VTVAAHPVIACYRGPDSVGALQLGAALATATRQPLVLATAYRYDPVALSARPLPADSNERRFEAAEAAVHRAHELVPAALNVREEVVPAEGVADALSTLARDEDACVLVLGRDLDGHVARDVIARARCPVAVSPFNVAIGGVQPLRRIVVADDGSPAASFARDAAQQLAEDAGAEVVALTAPDDTDAARFIVEASESYDLVVCGSRGRGRIVAALLGSVSGALVDHAHCPVLVIPPLVRRAAGRPLGLTTAGR
jgi:nucleotide-binding universal stress UspA family protein